MHKEWQAGIARLPRAAFLAPYPLVDFRHHAVLRRLVDLSPESMEVLTQIEWQIDEAVVICCVCRWCSGLTGCWSGQQAPSPRRMVFSWSA
jgi:hypothetical protein